MLRGASHSSPRMHGRLLKLDSDKERAANRGLRSKLRLRRSPKFRLRASNVLIGSDQQPQHSLFSSSLMSSTLMNSTKSISTSVQSAVNALLAELHAKAECEKLGLARDAFALALSEVSTKYLPASVSEGEVRAFLLTLRVDELAL